MEYLVKGENVFPFYLRQVGNNLSQDKPACWSTGGTNHRHMEDAITVHRIVKELNMKHENTISSSTYNSHLPNLPKGTFYWYT